MSRSIWILLLLALWIFLGIYFWERLNPFWNAGSSDAPCEIAWDLSDGSKSIAKSNATFNFTKSSANLVSVDPSLNDAVTTISTYLKTNKGKKMTVVGYHDHRETFGTNLYDLSMARANAVKSLLIAKGVPDNQLHVFPMQYDKDEDHSDCMNNNVLNRGASFKMGVVSK